MARYTNSIFSVRLEHSFLIEVHDNANSCTGRRVLMCNSYELQNELSDDKRFKKVVRGPLEQVRHATGDGLFTYINRASALLYVQKIDALFHLSRAHLEEPNWGIARTLLSSHYNELY